MDDLGLVEAVDRLSQSVVIAIADAANRGFDPGFGKAFGVLDGHVLRPTIAMMDEAAPMGRPAIVKRLFQGVEDEACMGRPAGPPADDPPSIGIDDWPAAGLVDTEISSFRLPQLLVRSR